MSMSNISGVVARVFVDGLDAAIPLYQQLAQTTTVNRFGFRDATPTGQSSSTSRPERPNRPS